MWLPKGLKPAGERVVLTHTHLLSTALIGAFSIENNVMTPPDPAGPQSSVAQGWGRRSRDSRAGRVAGEVSSCSQPQLALHFARLPTSLTRAAVRHGPASLSSLEAGQRARRAMYRWSSEQCKRCLCWASGVQAAPPAPPPMMQLVPPPSTSSCSACQGLPQTTRPHPFAFAHSCSSSGL